MHTCFDSTDSIHINYLWEKYAIVTCIIDAWGHMEILSKYFYTGRRQCRRPVVEYWPGTEREKGP